jgi:hypothetical protein
MMVSIPALIDTLEFFSVVYVLPVVYVSISHDVTCDMSTVLMICIECSIDLFLVIPYKDDCHVNLDTL